MAEVLPSKGRGKWLVAGFAMQAVGILLGALVGVVVLSLLPEISSWRIMLGFGVIPALIIIFLRRNVPESPRWLAQNGREEEAAEVAERLVGHPVEVTDADRKRNAPVPEGLKAFVQPALFKRDMIRRTIFTSAPWFLMDIATYGVGIFTPTLIAAIVVSGADTSFIADDLASTEATALLDIFLPIGFAIAIILVDRVGRIPLQITGFAGMTVALCLLAVSELLPGGADSNLALVLLGFALFNTFMNAGPNATTFALPAEVSVRTYAPPATASLPPRPNSGLRSASSSSRYCSMTSVRRRCCSAWPAAHCSAWLSRRSFVSNRWAGLLTRCPAIVRPRSPRA